MSKPKILIVDDEPFNIDYLEQELEDADYETISANNGQEALDCVQSGAPDLILLDIMMPVMDGFETLRRLKANPDTRSIPVIVISADTGLTSVVRGIQMGAEDYLPKPFEPILLHARVSSGLERKRLSDLQQLYLKSLEREFEIAAEIQRGFLPLELPQVSGWEVSAYLRAAKEVAGDFYDAFELPDGNLACLIGDVCGKGVGAALFMTLFRSLIRASSKSEDFFGERMLKPLSPVERLKKAITCTNRYVAETHDEANMFATVFIGIFERVSGKLYYINCGNEPPLLIRKGAPLTPLPPSGPVVGILEDAAFAVKEIVMENDDVLLAFTDGITDALDTKNVAFGNQRLRDLLNGEETSPAALLELINDRLCQFLGPVAQFDDITMLAVRRMG